MIIPKWISAGITPLLCAACAHFLYHASAARVDDKTAPAVRGRLSRAGDTQARFHYRERRVREKFRSRKARKFVEVRSLPRRLIAAGPGAPLRVEGSTVHMAQR